MLMNKKSDYISPEVDVFTLLSEGVICQSGNFGINGFGDDEGDPLDGFVGL